MPKRFFTYSRTQPARMIVFSVAWVTLLAGLFVFTPWHVPTVIAPAASAAFDAPSIAGGIINTAACAPALLAVRKNNPKHIARGAFWLFGLYLFVTLTRILLAPAGSLAFVPTLIIALVLAVVYLEQKAHERVENDWNY